MADEAGELQFVARMRDEATAAAREARAQLEALGGDVAHINIPVDVDTDPAQARAQVAYLEGILRQAELGIPVDVDLTRAARLRLRELKAELDALDTTADVRVNVRGTETLTEASRGVSNLMTALVILGPPAIAVLGVMGVAAGGLSAGLLAAAGAGGVLGGAIAGQVKGMVEANKVIEATSKKLDTLDEGSKEYRQTLRELHARQRAFARDFGPAAEGLTQVRKAWAQFRADTKTSSLGVIGAALKAAAQVLRLVAPLANAAAGGVRELIGEFRRWARGPEMKEILSFFETEGPGAIVSWGHIVGNIVLGVLNLLMAFTPEIDHMTGGLEDLTGKFRDWTAGLDESQGFREFLDYANRMLPLVGAFIGQLVTLVVRLATAFAPFSGPILAGLTGILRAINGLPTPVIVAFGVAIGGVVLALKAWQLGIFAVTAYTRIATVATLGYQAAMFTMGTTSAAYAARLGVAAVGIGGVALAAKKGGGAFSVLGGAASGALAGGMLGSFIPGAGTAVGAIVGGLVGLSAGLLTTGSSATKAGSDAAASVSDWSTLKTTLDAVTGATTAATRAMVYEDLRKSGVLKTTQALGIADRQVIDGVVKQGAERKKLVGTLQQQLLVDQMRRAQLANQPNTTAAIINEKKELDARIKNGKAALGEIGAVNKATAAKKKEIVATREFSKRINSLPPRVRTILETKILKPGDIVNLVSRYKTMQNIKKVSTLIRENGGTPTAKMVERIIAKAKELSRTRAEAKLKAKNETAGPIAAAKRALADFDGRSATAYITTVRRTRNEVGVGASAGGGAGAPRVAGGPAGRVTAGSATRVARAATTATAGASLVVKNLVTLFTKGGVDKISASVSTLNTRLDAYYRKRFKNAAQAARASAVTKRALADEIALVTRNAKARDAIVAKINAAKEAGNAAAEAARQQLDITSIQAVNDAPMTAGFIVKGLQDRVAAQARFIAQLGELERKGVDKALIGDLRQKGVDAAGAYVDALAGATGEQLSAVNKAQADIRAQATKIGADTTNGLAVGLASQLAAIDRAGVRLANALLRAVRRRLGIRSPSRELRGDGRYGVKGMIGGIDDMIPAAEAKAAELAARVQRAATPTLGQLAGLANAASSLTPTVRSSETITIRHEVTSPDGSLDNLTAEQVADLIARDPKAAAAVEKALERARARKSGNTITPSR